ncbi:unnamed protein product [Knipowitschia caucasica]|uniref:Uncharacterized protein n=1 Tax=Knipowitschia caucasica TaxID=637954 RepID=A0AAV2LDV9_KNICA
MAEQVSAVEDYLTCPVCLETFRDPVTLGCHHSFCSDCLQGFWDRMKSRDCPVCRRKSSKQIIFVNFALKELCVAVGDKVQSRARAGACLSHPQVPSLFCTDEARLLCPLCEFSQHREHTVVSVEEAATDLKQQLSSQLQSLQRSREQAQSVEQAYRDCQQHNLAQTQLCEKSITAHFETLHSFLKAEEQLRLSELRLQQEEKAQRLEIELATVSQTLVSLQEHIQQLEEQLQKNSEDFLVSYSRDRPRSHHEPKKPPPPLVPQLLIDQARVLGNLDFSVWRKMRSMVHFSPVVLDPNTAHPKLQVSEDMTSVRRGEDQQRPENPERFSEDICVLGLEGLRSGTHQWDVEVGDHPKWIIGVMEESVRRKKAPLLTPENGVWTVGLVNNKYVVFDETLELKQSPQRIQVQLDLDSGALSFYDCSDTSHIYTYKHTFTRTLLPFFYVGPSSADCQSKGLRICPAPVEEPVH